MGTHDQAALKAEIQAELSRLQVSSIAEANKVLAEMTTRRNSSPKADFCGLSSDDMAAFLYRPFNSPALVEFPSVLSAPPVDSRMAALFGMLASAIGDTGIKATETGNLPRNLCRSIAAEYLGEVELARYVQLRPIQSELDFSELNVTRVVGQLAGLLRMANGRFALTKICRQLLAKSDLKAIYPRLFRAYATKFNWSYKSLYGHEAPYIQDGFVFTLYLLDRFGDDWRPSSFYGDAFFTAFPQPLQGIGEPVFGSMKELIRLSYGALALSRFAVFLGLAEAQVTEPGLLGRMTAVRKTNLLSDAVRFHVGAP